MSNIINNKNALHYQDMMLTHSKEEIINSLLWLSGWLFRVGHLSVGALAAILFTMVLISSSAKAMTELKESELSKISGQALMQMGKTPGDAGSDLTFYKAGLDAELELNMNIEKLQLGCGGINGAGCDIDIDNLSLSGQTFPDGRPASGALLTRPFFEFAIKNDTSKTLREVVGIRLSAEQANGLLTAGTENSETANGINTLSGYMEIAATNGTAQTLSGDAYRFGRNTSCPVYGCGAAPPGRQGTGTSDADFNNWNPANRPNPSDETVTGRIDASVLFCTSGCSGYRAIRSRTDLSTGILLPQMDVPFNIGAFTLQGSRMTEASVNATASLPGIPITAADGSLYVELDSTVCSSLILCINQVENFQMEATITNVNVAIPFRESLGFIHKIPINNPFSLSLQNQGIRWPGSVEVAEQGWWMSFQDPIDLGELNPTAKVDIRPVYAEFAKLISQYVWDNPVGVNTADGLGAIFSGTVTKNLGNVDLGGATVTLPLADLQLETQSFTPNCWGAAKFC